MIAAMVLAWGVFTGTTPTNTGRTNTPTLATTYRARGVASIRVIATTTIRVINTTTNNYRYQYYNYYSSS